MPGYKYPYIADKKLYAAVMGACSYIRETGWFNKATQYYADKYDLDVELVREEVRKRQAAGQKGRKRGTYKWFVVERHVCSSGGFLYGPSKTTEGYYVVKATNKHNAERRFEYYPRDPYSPYYSGSAIYEGDSEEECENWLREYLKQKRTE